MNSRIVIPLNTFIFATVSAIIVIFFRNLPFFNDMGYTAMHATHIFDSNFSELLPPSEYSNGNPPLSALFLALNWSVFGKSLATSHISIVFPLIIFFFCFFKVASLFISKPESIIWCGVFILAEPTILSQIIYAGYDVILLALFFTGLYSIIEKKRYLLILISSLLPLLHLRGFSFVASLVISEIIIQRLYFNNPYRLKSLLKYVPSVGFFILWQYYVYVKEGYWLINPGNSGFHMGFSFAWTAKNTLLILWKMLDLGRVFIFAGIIGFAFHGLYYRKDNRASLLLLLLLAIILPYLFFFAHLQYPVGQRYFLHLSSLSIISFIFFTQNLKFLMATAIRLLAILILISGHFWIYPEKYGNGWDASLKSLPFFELHEKLCRDLDVAKIPYNSVAAEYPLIINHKYSNLRNDDRAFSDLNGGDIQDYLYIVDSNISNGFSLESRKKLKNEWTLINEYRKGQVYILLYQNPEIEPR